MAKKSFLVKLKGEWCKACGICVELCPTGTLQSNDDGVAYVQDTTTCIGCKSCLLHCPDFCFDIEAMNEQ